MTGYVSGGSETLTCAEMVPLFGYYFHGGFHPVGGSRKFTDALADAIRERNGQLWLDSPVAKISVENGNAAGLVLADGRRVSARAVVANSDLKRTFLELLGPAEVPDDFRAQIAASEPASSAFTVHLGVDFVPDIRPTVSVKGEQNIFITAMSMLDPSAAPPGHSTLTLITLLPQAEAQSWFPGEQTGGWKEWRQSPDYRDRKKALGDTMIACASSGEGHSRPVRPHRLSRRGEPGHVHALRLVEHRRDLRHSPQRAAERRQEPAAGAGGGGERNPWSGRRGRR